MALKIADRAKVITGTSGTGTYALDDAVAGYQSLAAVLADNDTTYYYCEGLNASGEPAWEVGIGTYDADTDTLARTTIISSSNSGGAVNWAAGTDKVLTITAPASKSLLLDAAGTGMVGLGTNLTLTGLTGTLTVPGAVAATTFSGAGTGLTGTATALSIGGNAATATTATNATTATTATNVSGGTASVTTLTASGAATFNGNVTLGDATSDVITVTGRLASDLTWGTDNTKDIGATGANRPRDLFLGRNATISGTMAVASNGSIFGNTVFGTTTSNTLTAYGTLYLGNAAGSESMRVLPVAGANRWLTASGANSGNPALGTSGGSLALSPENVETLRLVPVASGVNRVDVTGGATGNSPSIFFNGSDTNVSGIFYTKGTGGFSFITGTGGATQFQITHTATTNRWITATGSNGGNPALGTNAGALSLSPGGAESLRVAAVASAVNYLQVSGGVAGAPLALLMTGADTNVSGQWITKGTGNHQFFTNGSAPQFFIGHTASAVNYIQATGAATGAFPGFFAQGSDATVSIGIRTKGGGSTLFYSHDGAAVQFGVAAVASANRYVTVAGSNGGSPQISTNAGSLNLAAAGQPPSLQIAGTAGADRLVTVAGSNGGNPTIGTSGGNLAINPVAVMAAGASISAGGSVNAAMLMGSTGSIGLYFGSGAPTVSAGKGSLYLRTDGTGTNDRMYVNTNGTTGWTAVTTAA